jgi:hypothetical protein
VRRLDIASLLFKDVGWPTLSSRRHAHRLTLFYKIVNGLSPPYLINLLPPRVHERTRYPLRSQDNFTTGLCRLVHYAKSFIPDSIVEWNKLNNNIKGSVSVSGFKNNINLSIRRPQNQLYYFGSRWENVHLARMRIGCSLLKSHLHYNLHVVDSPRCQCGYPREDPKHYFFNCPLYALSRQLLWESVNLSNIDINEILYGDSTQDITTNENQLNAIHQYMRDTKRFVYV